MKKICILATLFLALSGLSSCSSGEDLMASTPPRIEAVQKTDKMIAFEKSMVGMGIKMNATDKSGIEEKQKMIETAKSYLSENDAAISNDATEMEILSQALHQHMKNLKTLNSQNQ